MQKRPRPKNARQPVSYLSQSRASFAASRHGPCPHPMQRSNATQSDATQHGQTPNRARARAQARELNACRCTNTVPRYASTNPRTQPSDASPRASRMARAEVSTNAMVRAHALIRARHEHAYFVTCVTCDTCRLALCHATCRHFIVCSVPSSHSFSDCGPCPVACARNPRRCHMSHVSPCPRSLFLISSCECNRTCTLRGYSLRCWPLGSASCPG
jgi:hypothetical protein